MVPQIKIKGGWPRAPETAVRIASTASEGNVVVAEKLRRRGLRPILPVALCSSVIQNAGQLSMFGSSGKPPRAAQWVVPWFAARVLLCLALVPGLIGVGGVVWCLARIPRYQRELEIAAVVERNNGDVFVANDAPAFLFRLLPDGSRMAGDATRCFPGWVRDLLPVEFLVTRCQYICSVDWHKTGGCHVGTNVSGRRSRGESRELTDDDYLLLSQLAGLEGLNLAGHQLTGTALKCLSRLSRLKRLELGDTRVGNADLESLTGMHQLSHLGIAGTRVTDEGLKTLLQLPRLETLNAGRTHITSDGVEMLKAERAITVTQNTVPYNSFSIPWNRDPTKTVLKARARSMDRGNGK